MKTIITTIAIILFSITSNASSKYYCSYKNNYIDISYSMFVTMNDANTQINSIMIDAFSIEKESKGGIIMNYNLLNRLPQELKIAKENYMDYKNQYKNDTVKNIYQSIDLVSNFSCYFYKPNNSYTTRVVNAKYTFASIRRDDGHYDRVLILSTGPLQADNSPFIRHEGFAITFENEAEIDAFIELISVAKIMEWSKK